MVADVRVLDHPLIQHKLTLMRRKETSTTNFRRLLNEIGYMNALAGDSQRAIVARGAWPRLWGQTPGYMGCQTPGQRGYGCSPVY